MQLDIKTLSHSFFLVELVINHILSWHDFKKTVMLEVNKKESRFEDRDTTQETLHYFGLLKP